MNLPEYTQQINNIIQAGGYTLGAQEKSSTLEDLLAFLDHHHSEGCMLYRNLHSNLSKSSREIDQYIPARLFKEFNWTTEHPLLHGGKTFLSSGTSDSNRSQIFIDTETSNLQRQCFVSLFKSFIGSKRLPMLIINSKRSNLSDLDATRAGSAAFMLFSKKIFFANTENGELNQESIQGFHAAADEGGGYVFGLTTSLYQYLRSLRQMKIGFKNKNNLTFIHGGGWKKMADRGLSENDLKNDLQGTFDSYRLFEYYGLVEQLGTIFFKCSEGFFHCSDLSDVSAFNRIGQKLETQEAGMLGITSLLPLSYPGHRVLTEDSATIVNSHGVVCKCGLESKKFILHGRLPRAEVRGCANVAN